MYLSAGTRAISRATPVQRWAESSSLCLERSRCRRWSINWRRARVGSSARSWRMCLCSRRDTSVAYFLYPD